MSASPGSLAPHVSSRPLYKTSSISGLLKANGARIGKAIALANVVKNPEYTRVHHALRDDWLRRRTSLIAFSSSDRLFK